jgi:signal transduction histidine kinase
MSHPGQVPIEPRASHFPGLVDFADLGVTSPAPWRDSVSRGTLTVCAVVGPLLAALGLFVGSTHRDAPDVAVLVIAGVLLPVLRWGRRASVRSRAVTAIIIMFAAALYLTARAGFAAGANGVVVSACVLGGIIVGRRLGLALIGLSALAHVVIGILVVKGVFVLDPREVDPLVYRTWFRMAASTALLAVLLGLVIDFVIRHVEANARATASALTELRGAHEALRESEERHRVLAELGAVLSPLRYESSLTDVAPLVAHHLADVVVFFVVQADGEVQRVAAATRDPAEAWIAEVFMSSLRATVRPDHPVQRVVQDRKPVISQFTPEALEKVAENPGHLRGLRAMGLRSSMMVPLNIGETCQGALAMASGGHVYGETDLPLALEIGRRCALFIESARLHRSEKAAIQARDEVLAIVAHDLRNPLATMMFQLALLRRPPGKPERRSMESVEALEHAARRMSRILQDLLDVTRFESGQLVLVRSRVSPAEVIVEVSKSQRQHVSSRSLELFTDVAAPLPDVWADRSRVLQVLENLIGNATKFTVEGSVSLGAKADGGEVVFWVTDTGAGIAAEDIPRVFDRFWQARRAQRSGAGLGLAIVREIVHAHKGRLWVESTLGSGSTFFFTLPTVPEPAKAP